ncbi:hypothetical protein GCM10027592_06080 [Spirosoma flavus]
MQTDAVSTTQRIDRPTPEAEKTPKQYYEDRSTGDAPVSNDPDEVRSLAIAQFAYSLLTLIGAILMFRLQRIGFWIYVAGVAVGLFLPVILAGFVALNTSFGVFFSLLFVGLYWTMVKEMK